MHLNKLNNFRVLKNLGSRITKVIVFDEEDHTGYQAFYNEGDECLADKSKKYSSRVKYQCDPDGQNGINDYPKMVVNGEYQGINQCKFDFVWFSKFACSPCRLDQVNLFENFCRKGHSEIHATRKPGENCVIDFPPDKFIEKNPDYLENKRHGIIKHQGYKYVTKPLFHKKCSLLADITEHPILKFFSQLLASVMVILVCCLTLTCVKYNRVSNEYEQVRQAERPSGGDSQIFRRNDSNV